MTIANEDFSQRTKEINTYFSFLEFVDNSLPKIQVKSKNKIISKNIDTQLIKILKANGYLLIYNLVEASCRNAIWEILNATQNRNYTYLELSDEMKKMWIKQNVKNLNDNKTKIESLENQFFEIAKNLTESSIIDFKIMLEKLKPIINEFETSNIENIKKQESKIDYFGLSGNIDAKKMREIAVNFGFNQNVGKDASKAEETLLKIKTMRNKLAHGRLTFTESVENVSIPDMINYKIQSIKYIKFYFKNVEKYISALNK